MPNSRLKRELISLYLTPEDAAALRALAKRTGKPQQALLREGVSLMFKRHAKMVRS